MDEISIFSHTLSKMKKKKTQAGEVFNAECKVNTTGRLYIEYICISYALKQTANQGGKVFQLVSYISINV